MGDKSLEVLGFASLSQLADYLYVRKFRTGNFDLAMNKRPIPVAILAWLASIVAVVWSITLLLALIRTPAAAWSSMPPIQLLLWFGRHVGTLLFSAVTALALFKKWKSGRWLGACYLFLAALLYFYGLFILPPPENPVLPYRMAYENPNFGNAMEVVFKLAVVALLCWWGWRVVASKNCIEYFHGPSSSES